jgi:ABC-type multidrug transport system fused ATPase/permease subunit
MIIVMQVRGDVTQRSQRALEEAEMIVIESINDAVINYRVICDYFRRPKVCGEIDDAIMRFNRRVSNWAGVRTNNEWCPRWVSVVTQNTALVLGGSLLLNSSESWAIPLALGTYLALLNLIKSSGDNFMNMYKTYLIMHDAFLPLWRVVRFLNQPEDVPKRKAANRKRRRRGEEMRTAIRQAMSEEDLKMGVPVVDLLPLKFEGFGFGFGDALVLDDITREFRQGSLVVSSGLHRPAKASFWRCSEAYTSTRSGQFSFRRIFASSTSREILRCWARRSRRIFSSA